MLEGKIDINDWEKTTDSTDYINSKDGGKTHFCDTMEQFRHQLIQYKEKNGLLIDYENNNIAYLFLITPSFEYDELTEFEQSIKYLFIKSIKSRNTINIIRNENLSLEEELARSKQTLINAREAIINIDYALDKYFQEKKKSEEENKTKK